MKKINIDFKFNIIDQGCLIACLEMVMRKVQPDFSINTFLATLHEGEFGYDIQEVAERLIQNGYNVEYGFYDEDVLGKNFKINKTLLDSLKKVLENEEIHSQMKPLLVDTINFASKYPKNIKIAGISVDVLKNFLNRDTSIIVHLNGKDLGASVAEEIHAVIVNGYDEKGLFIVNPPKIAEEHVDFKNFNKFWKEAGYYYLVIRNGKKSYTTDDNARSFKFR